MLIWGCGGSGMSLRFLKFFLALSLHMSIESLRKIIVPLVFLEMVQLLC